MSTAPTMRKRTDTPDALAFRLFALVAAVMVAAVLGSAVLSAAGEPDGTAARYLAGLALFGAFAAGLHRLDGGAA